MLFEERIAGAYFRSLGMDVPGAYRLMLDNHQRSRREIESQQQAFLDATLRLACEKVPYYRERGLAPRLADFPVMRKEVLDRELERLVAPGSDRRRAKIASGSGTSRIATRLLVDKPSYAWHYAGRWRSLALHGVGPAARSILMAQHRQPQRWRRIKAQLGEYCVNRFLISILVQNEAAARRIHARLAQLQPVAIDAVTSLLESYVLWCRRLGLPPVKSLRLIRPTGENISAEQRALFDAYFGVRQAATYGAREFGFVASECAAGRYHLYPECCYYEVLRADGSIGPMGTGRILVTTLHNSVMPLIRYDPGDFVTLTDEPCPCGLPLPVLAEIHGRSSELFFLPDGSTVSSRAMYVIFEYRNLDTWRVTQDGDDHLTVELVPTSAWGGGDESVIRSGLDRATSGQLRYDLIYRQAIAPLPNGKNPKVVNATERRY